MKDDETNPAPEDHTDLRWASWLTISGVQGYFVPTWWLLKAWPHRSGDVATFVYEGTLH